MQEYVSRLAPRLQLLYSAAAAASPSSCTSKLSGQYTWVNIEVVAVKPYAAVVVSSFYPGRGPAALKQRHNQ